MATSTWKKQSVAPRCFKNFFTFTSPSLRQTQKIEIKTIKFRQKVDESIVVTYTLQIFGHHMQGYELRFLTHITGWHCWVTARVCNKIMHGNSFLRLMDIIGRPRSRRQTIPKVSVSVNIRHSKTLAPFYVSDEGLQPFRKPSLTTVLFNHWTEPLSLKQATGNILPSNYFLPAFGCIFFKACTIQPGVEKGEQFDQLVYYAVTTMPTNKRWLQKKIFPSFFLKKR